MAFPQRLRKPGYRYLALLLLLSGVVSAPKWGRALLHQFNFFHVHTVEIQGTRYLQPTDVVARLRVDTLQSLFDDLAPLEARLRSHPQVAGVTITRTPPGTLVVTIVENLPIALVPSVEGLQPYDSAGKPLPIDPSRTDLDLPVLTPLHKPTLGLLGALRAQYPQMYSRISQVQRERGGDVIFVLTSSLRVRTGEGVAPDRFHDIFPVESDLARRNERPVELDLRYRDQVVARLP